MVRIAILNLIDLSPEQGGGEVFGQAIKAWLAGAMPGDDLEVIEVATGTPVPEVGDYDGFVLGGSEKGVYDPTPWMAPLRALLLDARARRLPVFGICFGHQLMADTFGGKAELHDQGEVVGTRRFHAGGRAIDAYVWHQDQVTKVPPGARVVGGADYCPVGILAYDFPALSVQFHPEYTREILSTAIARNQGFNQSPEITKARLASVAAGAVPVDLMAKEAAELLRGRA